MILWAWWLPCEDRVKGGALRTIQKASHSAADSTVRQDPDCRVSAAGGVGACWLGRWADLGFEGRIQRPPFVKDKTFPLKIRMPAFFEVFEDAAFELENVVDAGYTHEDRGLLAAYAAGAKTHDSLAGNLLPVIQQGLGKFGELADAPVDGIFEGADVHFKVIACVQRDHRPAGIVMTGVLPALERGGV